MKYKENKDRECFVKYEKIIKKGVQFWLIKFQR